MKKITNLAELEAACKEKNIKTDIVNGMLGISTHKAIWHWFTQSQSIISKYVIFDHTYSMNTGKSKRGLMHRATVLMNLGKKLNAQL